MPFFNSAFLVFSLFRETCILSICQLDINETIVGFLALKDFPLVPSVNPAAWVDCVWSKFKYVNLLFEMKRKS